MNKKTCYYCKKEFTTKVACDASTTGLHETGQVIRINPAGEKAGR